MSHLPFYSNGIKNKQLLFQCFYAYLDFNCTFYFIGIILENTESIIVKIEKSAIRINRYFDYISAQITSDFLLQSKKNRSTAYLDYFHWLKYSANTQSNNKKRIAVQDFQKVTGCFSSIGRETDFLNLISGCFRSYIKAESAS